jgi:hexosaminidase
MAASLRWLAVLLVTTTTSALAADATMSIVPRPMQIEETGRVATLKTIERELTGPPALGDEGYILDTTGDAIRIYAHKPAGLFYAEHTLDQLLSADRRTLPAVRITDRPRFSYRGLLLDSARHMQSIDFLKRTIDLLAHYKINRLHWHLTDDVGWRVEIEKYPKLMEVGAWRGEGDQRYGGYYTKAQLKDLVAYAAERHVTIIPEIEMPGHAQAAVASYPQISCRGEPVAVLPEFKQSEEPLCPSNEATYAFVAGVLDEVTEIFPSPVIHLGGDECPRTRWKECGRCQALMKEKGWTSEDSLQNYFTHRVADMLGKKGRRMQGWSEVMAGGELPKDAIVHQWLDASAGAAAARAGHDVVVSQHEWLYFDYDYARTPMRKTYAFDPMPPGLSAAEHQQRIVGVQSCLWTEYRPTEIACDDFLWPRMLAVAEMAWTPQEARDWADFLRRLESGGYAHLARRSLGADRADRPALQRKLTERGGT